MTRATTVGNETMGKIIDLTQGRSCRRVVGKYILHGINLQFVHNFESKAVAVGVLRRQGSRLRERAVAHCPP